MYWFSHSSSPSQYNIYSFPSDVPKDWTNYNGIVLKIYSERPTNALIRVSLHSPRNSANVARYLYGDIRVDWSGWKTISFNFKDMTSRNSPSLYTMAERTQLEARENCLNCNPKFHTHDSGHSTSWIPVCPMKWYATRNLHPLRTRQALTL